MQVDAFEVANAWTLWYLFEFFGVIKPRAACLVVCQCWHQDIIWWNVVEIKVFLNSNCVYHWYLGHQFCWRAVWGSFWAHQVLSRFVIPHMNVSDHLPNIFPLIVMVQVCQSGLPTCSNRCFGHWIGILFQFKIGPNHISNLMLRLLLLLVVWCLRYIIKFHLGIGELWWDVERFLKYFFVVIPFYFLVFLLFLAWKLLIMVARHILH